MAKANPTDPPPPAEDEECGEEQSAPTLAELCERARALDEEVRRHLEALHRRGAR